MSKSNWKNMTPEQQQAHRERERTRRKTKANCTPEEWAEVQRKRRAGAARRGNRDVEKARELRRSPHYRFTAWANSCRARAKELGVPCDIDGEYLKSIYTTHCPVLGVEFAPRDDRKTNAPYCATVDRIVPELGYTRGNVIIVCRRANNIKSDASIDEIQKVLDFYSGRK